LDHQDDGKATPVKQFSLANIMYGEAMKEPFQNRGASLTKNDLIISSACSKGGNMPIYEATTKEYNLC
jgi:hypothetical protein